MQSHTLTIDFSFFHFFNEKSVFSPKLTCKTKENRCVFSSLVYKRGHLSATSYKNNSLIVAKQLLSVRNDFTLINCLRNKNEERKNLWLNRRNYVQREKHYFDWLRVKIQLKENKVKCSAVILELNVETVIIRSLNIDATLKRIIQERRLNVKPKWWDWLWIRPIQIKMRDQVAHHQEHITRQIIAAAVHQDHQVRRVYRDDPRARNHAERAIITTITQTIITNITNQICNIKVPAEDIFYRNYIRHSNRCYRIITCTMKTVMDCIFRTLMNFILLSKDITCHKNCALRMRHYACIPNSVIIRLIFTYSFAQRIAFYLSQLTPVALLMQSNDQ